MKRGTIILAILGLVVLNSCKQKTDVDAMLANTETRDEIFKAVVADHDMMQAFIETMQDSDHAMQMMRGKKSMMGKMMRGDGMKMMMKDSSMMDEIMNGMMRDGRMMNYFMRKMEKDSIMSKDCMQSCQQMMMGKGKMMNQ